MRAIREQTLKTGISIKGRADFVKNQEYVLGAYRSGSGQPGYQAGHGAWSGLRAGSYLTDSDRVFQMVDRIWVSEQGETGGLGLKVLAMKDFSLDGTLETDLSRKGFSLAWITLSDKGASGQREDESGPLIEALCSEVLDISLARGFIIPDDPRLLRSLLDQLCLVSGYDLVLTTGGTGVGPRDFTPEVTRDLVDRLLPGFERAMLNASLAKTPHAVISRAAAGTLDLSLVINLPGSPKGVRENFQAIAPALNHTLKKLQGDQSDCASG